MAQLPFPIDPPAEDSTTSPLTPADEDASSSRRGKRTKSDTPLTVSDAAGLIKTAIGQHLPGKLRIVGEISNFSNRNHWFFSLKDENATLRCVCFASSARRVGFDVHDGIEVVATGRLDFFDAQGSLQLYVDRLEPVGIGELEQQYRQLVSELRDLSYFDVERKKAVPTVPRAVAVVTSWTGAALQDVLDTASKRWPGCRLHVMDVRVQGPSAAPEISRAIRALSEHSEEGGAAAGIDAIILTRGGGSIEDLWAFNERIVADAIYECSLPIVAAIGHETDTTIAELVADVRCATPTQAAMHVIPDAEQLRAQTSHLFRRLELITRRYLEHQEQRLAGLGRQPMLRQPAAMITPLANRLAHLRQRLQLAVLPATRQAEQRLAPLPRRLNQAVDRLLDGRSRQLDQLVRQLDALGPQHVLARGYSYTLGPDGRVLRSSDQVAAGDRIETVLSQGRVASRVEGEGAATDADKTSEAKTPRTDKAASSPKPRRRRREKPIDPSQLGLFEE